MSLQIKEGLNLKKNEVNVTNDKHSDIVESRLHSSTTKNIEDLSKSSDLEVTENVVGSRHVRRIIAEDPEYNLARVTELQEKSLHQIIENFTFNANMYLKLKPSHKRRVLEKLKLDVPLKVVTDLIEDGTYWKRKCLGRWALCNINHYGESWKRMFLERNLEEIIESFRPEKTDRTCLEDTLDLSAPYVLRLIITQMLPPDKVDPKVVIKDDGSDADSDVEELPKIDHLYMQPIITKLPNLTELRLSYDVQNCGMNFEWIMFLFTINDCLQLAKCVASATQLQVFHLTRSCVDCDRCRVLVSNLLDHPSLIELDLSHNHIGDRGARALAKMINDRCKLQVLKVTNNMIKTVGAQALASALLKNKTLQVLNLRLNRIMDEGGYAICKALISNNILREINLAGNEMTDNTATILARVVKKNSTLTSMDLSNNRFGPDGGKKIQDGMVENRTLVNMDMRFTDSGDDILYAISQVISFNQKLKIYENELDEEIQIASPYIIADQYKHVFMLNDDTDERSFSSAKGSVRSMKTSNLFKLVNEDASLSIN